jgi:hypothetical protein
MIALTWPRVMSLFHFLLLFFSVRVTVNWILGNVYSLSLFLIDLDVNIHKTEHVSYIEAIRTIQFPEDLNN